MKCQSNAVLDAMCIPAGQRVSPFPGARSLLAAIRDEGLRCVIVSNTVWRSAAAYRRDFEGFGVGMTASSDRGHRTAATGPRPPPRLRQRRLLLLAGYWPRGTRANLLPSESLNSDHQPKPMCTGF